MTFALSSMTLQILSTRVMRPHPLHRPHHAILCFLPSCLSERDNMSAGCEHSRVCTQQNSFSLDRRALQQEPRRTRTALVLSRADLASHRLIWAQACLLSYMLRTATLTGPSPRSLLEGLLSYDMPQHLFVNKSDGTSNCKDVLGLRNAIQRS